jgi:hypothetical protein
MGTQSCGNTRGNEKADQVAKEGLDEDISTTERYPPEDLKKWLTEEDFKKRDQRWKNGNNEMKGRKTDEGKSNNSVGHSSLKGSIGSINLFELNPYGFRMERALRPLLKHFVWDIVKTLATSIVTMASPP